MLSCLEVRDNRMVRGL